MNFKFNRLCTPTPNQNYCVSIQSMGTISTWDKICWVFFFFRGRVFSTLLAEHPLLEIQEVKATLNKHAGLFFGKLLSRHLHLSHMDSSIQDFESSVYSPFSSLCSCSVGDSVPLWFSENKLELEKFLAQLQLRCFHPLETLPNCFYFG